MTTHCITLIVSKDGIQQGKKIQLTSEKFINSTIIDYEWSINNIIDSTRTSSLIIDTNKLPLGLNMISHKVQNLCGSWSVLVTKNVNIINPCTRPACTLTIQ